MKIIHVVLGKANPERMNGVNKVAHNLATTMTNLGYDVTLWGITKSLEINYPPRNYPTELFKHVSNKFRIDENLTKAIENLPKDAVVHMHGSFITEFFHIARLLKKHNVPYIYTSHGSLGPKAMERNAQVKKVYFNLLEKVILKNAKIVHLLGKSEVDNVAVLMPKLNNTRTIPNGQNLDAIPTINVYKNGREHPIFGFCGRLDANHKGLDLLFEGYANYLKKGGKGTLELIGNGVSREELETQATALGIQDKVTFYGAKYGDEKFNLIANFDVFMHTSRMEGFPTAVLEAAALNLPCITSEATNINGYIRQYDAGYALEHNTPSDISKALLEADTAFKNKSLTTKSQNARRMVETEFNWEAVSKQLIKAYGE